MWDGDTQNSSRRHPDRNETLRCSPLGNDDLEVTPENEVVVRASDGRRFRRSICVFVMNERGQFLGCRRADTVNVLQCVQGGAKWGETPQETSDREVMEEIGIPPGQLEFVSEIVWTDVGGHSSKNWDGPRGAFRYRSKSWLRFGICGQELYPLLYYAHSSIINSVNFRSVSGVRQEFIGATWVPLDILRTKCSKSKRVAVENMCRAVEAFLRVAEDVPRRLPQPAEAKGSKESRGCRAARALTTTENASGNAAGGGSGGKKGRRSDRKRRGRGKGTGGSGDDSLVVNSGKGSP